jgi:ankyrin repeat protein
MVDYSVPGNRLREEDGKLELTPIDPFYRIGESLRTVAGDAVTLVSKVVVSVKQVLNPSQSNRAPVPTIRNETCPLMSTWLDLTRIVCENGGGIIISPTEGVQARSGTVVVLRGYSKVVSAIEFCSRAGGQGIVEKFIQDHSETFSGGSYFEAGFTRGDESVYLDVSVVVPEDGGRVCLDAQQFSALREISSAQEMPNLGWVVAKVDQLAFKIIHDDHRSVTRGSLLNAAIETGELRTVELFVKEGLVNELEGGISPLYRACEGGHVDIARLLLRHCANPNGKNDLSCRFGISAGSSPDHDATPMRPAVRSGNVELVRLLICAGASLDKPEPKGGAPVFEAVRAGHEDLALALIELGADTSRRSRNTAIQEGREYFPLIHLAAARGQIRVVQELLKRGENVNSDETDSSETVLHVVAGSQHPDILQFLLDHGAQEVLNKRWLNVWTPIVAAVNGGDLASVKILAQAGADLSLRYKDLNLLEHAQMKLRESRSYYDSYPEAMEREGRRIIQECQAIVDYLTPLFVE